LQWDTATVFVSTWTGLFKSTNGGGTWNSSFIDFNVRCIEVDPIAKIVFIGTRGNGAYKSTDEGKSWIPINNPEIPVSMSMAMDVFDIAVNPQNPNNLYLGTGIGPYKSINSGNTWLQSFDGMRNFFAYDIKISPSDPSIIYTAGRHGVHISTNYGRTWRYIGAGGTFNKVAIDPINPNIVYASMVGLDLWNYIRRTTNGGIEWNDVSPYPPSPTFIPFIEIDNSQQRAIYTSTYDEFLRSFDRGETWQTILSPIIPTSLAIANDDSNLLYISSRKGELYKSTDRGETWDSLGLTKFGTQCFLRLDPKNSKTIFAAIVEHGVYKSIDGGYVWNKITKGLDSSGLNVLLISKNSNELFLKNNDGIFHSKNGGDAWHLFSEHPFNDSYYGIKLDTNGTGRFLIGSNIPGIYILNLNLTNVEESASIDFSNNFVLYQNFPNPFNPSTVIKFILIESTNAKLEIFDILGRKIKTLLNSYLQKGLHSTMWDGRNDKGKLMPNGVYIYRLTTDKLNESKKMIFTH
jgi:photosystem II stability/assembly factor-like uncharacterized protein